MAKFRDNITELTFESNYYRIESREQLHILSLHPGLNRTIIGLKDSRNTPHNRSVKSLNRTIIGLKDSRNTPHNRSVKSLNRTIIGLKVAEQYRHGSAGYSLNRTIIGLKVL